MTCWYKRSLMTTCYQRLVPQHFPWCLTWLCHRCVPGRTSVCGPGYCRPRPLRPQSTPALFLPCRTGCCDTGDLGIHGSTRASADSAEQFYLTCLSTEKLRNFIHSLRTVHCSPSLLDYTSQNSRVHKLKSYWTLTCATCLKADGQKLWVFPTRSWASTKSLIVGQQIMTVRLKMWALKIILWQNFSFVC